MSMDITIPIEAKLKYIERRKKDFESCDAAVKAQDYKFFQKIGHDLKGNAITFGFAPLSSLGEKLEAAANKNDIESVKTLVKSYGDYLKTVKVTS
jgi:HPt (histidine-containing phosphotransfer) domain-containing protein